MGLTASIRSPALPSLFFPSMKLHTYRHLWGVNTPLDEFLAASAAAGYAGIETGLNTQKDPAAFAEWRAASNLKWIAMVFTAGNSVEEHLDSLRRQVEQAAEFSPEFINSHSGLDRFSLAESVRYFEGALKVQEECGLTLAHETHRGRILFNPWITRDILREVPGTTLTADFSHWVCVCERLLGGCEEELALAAAHTLHIHARVGHEEGPQVSDPRAPEFAGHVSAHEKWWDAIWSSQRERGLPVSTLTPEFGPPSYMTALPYTRQPVASLYDICEWMTTRQRERFGS